MPTPHLPRHVPIAATFRGGHPENVHFGSFAVVSASGDVLASAGDIDFPLFTRSALKPFQAMPLIAQAVFVIALVSALLPSADGAPERGEAA